LTIDGEDTPVGSKLNAFYFFADTPRRRAALRLEPGAAERYVLYGLDQLAARGDTVAHNLEGSGRLPHWTRLADRAVATVLRRVNGTGGDLAPALACRRSANRSDVVVATIDRMGIPLTLLARTRLLRTALVYVSVGLPERLERLGGRVRELHLSALDRADAFVAYSEHEADVIRSTVAVRTRAPVVFVPFGVDTRFFSPRDEARPDLDVVSIGADPHRDYALLLRIAERRPEWRFHLVVSPEAARALATAPANVRVEVDVAFTRVRDLLARARVVALPVRDNSYSGATTVLLQAMATARPVVVSRTAAIESGYGLADGENCLLVQSGDEAGFERALGVLIADQAEADALGRRARGVVEASLTWELYAAAMRSVLVDAVARHSAR
jgi:glycosyltransferase involved in cell wall biosynthesis